MTKTTPGVDEEETLRRLLADAGPRPAPPEEDLASLKETARTEWRQRYSDQSSPARPVRFWMALAAAALLAAVGLFWWARTPGPPIASDPSVASLERLSGAARWEARGERASPLLLGAIRQPLPAGSLLTTEAGSDRWGRLALRMAGGASVRLDTGTRVRLVSATVIELNRGAVYVDTGAKQDRREEVAIRTSAGLFQGIGTQFEVRAEGDGDSTRLRVREGSVRLDRVDGSVLTNRGEELVLQGDGILLRRQSAAYGPEWDWVLKTAPMLDIEGVKLRTFLDWVAREMGWRVEFADEETTSLSDSIVLHGSIDHLTPSEAPSVVLPSSGLGHRASEGTLLVFVASKEGR